jgi:hypothetical protein
MRTRMELRRNAPGYPPLAPLAPNVNPDRARKLGLELKRQEDILPVYTAERIERPAAN